MTPTEYHEQRAALSSAMREAQTVGARLRTFGGDEKRVQLLHGALGLATEAGELLDAIKRAIYYGKELDRTNLVEECGDVLWYLDEALDAQGRTLEDAMVANLAKLRKRYPQGFTEHHATNRDTEAEAAAIDSAAKQQPGGVAREIARAVAEKVVDGALERVFENAEPNHAAPPPTVLPAKDTDPEPEPEGQGAEAPQGSPLFYRLLNPGETIQPGDEFLRRGAWYATKNAGGTVQAGIYRRTAIARALDAVPTFYRILEEGETLQPGDEFLTDSRGWTPAGTEGQKVYPGHVGRYRRPVFEPPAKQIAALRGLLERTRADLAEAEEEARKATNNAAATFLALAKERADRKAVEATLERVVEALNLKDR